MKRKFSSKEVNEYVFSNEIERIEGEDRRWSRSNTSFVKVDNKYYRLFWEHGLTEGQESYFEEQESEEYEFKEIEKTIIKKVWTVKEEKNDS